MATILINEGMALAKKQATNSREKIVVVNRKKLYWISQIIGWTVLITVNLLIISSFEALPFNRIVVWIVLGICGIAFTHLYRIHLKKHNWANLPLKKIIPRVLIASFILGIIIFIPVFASSFLLNVEREAKHFTASIAAGIINLTSIAVVWSLIYFSIHYFENYKRSEIESFIFEAAVKDFELKTLKAQLNPHFMFNAMNSIRALIEEDPKSAKDAITKLSSLFRYALKIERTETVPLGEELKTIQDYLDLEKIRFEERLNYKIISTPDADRVEIPPMMVQTLVENGIKHGISKITDGGVIEIDSNISDAKLHIKIKNTGQFKEGSVKISNGFGISNTKHRLSLLYGENASFTIKNENHKVVLTEIIIPLGGSK
jgi:sensor histidine kinase YesM